MLSTLRRLFCCKGEPKTPLGFCDGPSSGHRSFPCFSCGGTEDRYSQPYDPKNKFHEAVCEGRIKKVLRLLSKEKFQVNDQDERERTALHFACFYGHLHLVTFLIFMDASVNALDDEKSSPLMKAVQSLETKIVSVLLQDGADPSIKDVNGETALHHAVYVDSPDIARRLLQSGADIEETTKDGFTPLLLALRERKLLVAEHLITHGANIHALDDYQRTTLMYGIKWDSQVIVGLLLEKGVDHYLKDAFGWNALQYAMAGKRKVVSVILDYKASPLLSSEHSLVAEDQPEDICSSGYHIKYGSLTSLSSRIEEKDNLETQQDIPENILETDVNDLPTPPKHWENIEAQEDFSEELEEEIPEYKLENERSFHSTETQESETPMEVPQSSNVDFIREENVIRHLEKEERVVETVLNLKVENENAWNENERYQKPEVSRKASLSSTIGTDTEKNKINQDLSEELEEEIPEYKLESERSFHSTETQESETPMEVPQSSNVDNIREENVVKHLKKESVMEDQDQTS